jgi:hypothetical protein
MEVIVVVDGPDPHTAALIFKPSPIRDCAWFFSTSGAAVPMPATAGVRAGCGEWIAFLDDDDEWLPEKIDRQMRAAHAMPDWFPVVSCRLIAQSPTTSRVLPLRPYRAAAAHRRFSCFAAPACAIRAGSMQSSTLLAPRELLLAVPFQSGLPMHQDWDWLIRVTAHTGVGVAMVRQPLTIWRMEDARATVGRNAELADSSAVVDPEDPARSGFLSRLSPGSSPFSVFGARSASHAGLLARLTLLRTHFFLEGQPEVPLLHSAFSSSRFIPAPDSPIPERKVFGKRTDRA